MGKVLSLWFGFSQFNELWSCCELCAFPYRIREEGPIISVALLLSPLPVLSACHAGSLLLQTPSLLLPSISGHLFPRARLSNFWDRGMSSPPMKVATNSVALIFKEQGENPRVKRWDSSCFREEILPQFWLQTAGRWGGMPGEIQLWFCLICILIPALLPPFFLLKTWLLHRWTYGVTIHGFSHVPLMNYLSKGTGGDFFGFTDFFRN